LFRWPSAIFRRLFRRALLSGRERAALRWARRLPAEEALIEALRLGSAGLVRELLLGDSQAIRRKSAWRPDGRHSGGGGSLLWEAARSPRERIAKLRALVAAGADVNSTSLPRGVTLLALALAESDSELREAALALGADVNKPDRRGVNPLSIAELQEDDAAIARLKRAGAAAGPATAQVGASLVEEAERAFLQERPLFSEVHEVVKWAVREAGFELRSVRIPGRWPRSGEKSTEEVRILYRIEKPGISGLRLRLGFPGGSELSLVLLGELGDVPLADLLPSEGWLTPALLRIWSPH
jgi:hypothetical protein